MENVLNIKIDGFDDITIKSDKQLSREEITNIVNQIEQEKKQPVSLESVQKESTLGQPLPVQPTFISNEQPPQTKEEKKQFDNMVSSSQPQLQEITQPSFEQPKIKQTKSEEINNKISLLEGFVSLAEAAKKGAQEAGPELISNVLESFSNNRFTKPIKDLIVDTADFLGGGGFADELDQILQGKNIGFENTITEDEQKQVDNIVNNSLASRFAVSLGELSGSIFGLKGIASGAITGKIFESISAAFPKTINGLKSLAKESNFETKLFDFVKNTSESATELGTFSIISDLTRISKGEQSALDTFGHGAEVGATFNLIQQAFPKNTIGGFLTRVVGINLFDEFKKQVRKGNVSPGGLDKFTNEMVSLSKDLSRFSELDPQRKSEVSNAINSFITNSLFVIKGKKLEDFSPEFQNQLKDLDNKLKTGEIDVSVKDEQLAEDLRKISGIVNKPIKVEPINQEPKPEKTTKPTPETKQPTEPKPTTETKTEPENKIANEKTQQKKKTVEPETKKPQNENDVGIGTEQKTDNELANHTKDEKKEFKKGQWIFGRKKDLNEHLKDIGKKELDSIEKRTRIEQLQSANEQGLDTIKSVNKILLKSQEGKEINLDEKSGLELRLNYNKKDIERFRDVAKDKNATEQDKSNALLEIDKLIEDNAVIVEAIGKFGSISGRRLQSLSKTDLSSVSDILVSAQMAKQTFEVNPETGKKEVKNFLNKEEKEHFTELGENIEKNIDKIEVKETELKEVEVEQEIKKELEKESKKAETEKEDTLKSFEENKKKLIELLKKGCK